MTDLVCWSWHGAEYAVRDVGGDMGRVGVDYDDLVASLAHDADFWGCQLLPHANSNHVYQWVSAVMPSSSCVSPCVRPCGRDESQQDSV